MSFDFFPSEQDANLLNAARRPSTTPEAGAWDGFARGTGLYAMRSLVEAGRAVSMAGAVVPILTDELVGADNFSGESYTDAYFKRHDAIFNRAVDDLTPHPGEVGVAGQVAGQLVGGVMQAIVSPALLVGTAQLSTTEDLVRNGVDATTANTVGAVQGTAMATGLKLPFVGQSLATRVLSGAGGNLAQGTGSAVASSEILKAQGYVQDAERFNPWDLRARTLDAMLGAAFGGLAHLEARAAPKITPTQEAALLVANQARHMEDATPQGRPATDVDTTLHVDAMRQAVDQVLRDEPVTVDALTKGMRLVPDETQRQHRAEIVEEAQRLAARDAPLGDPITTRTEGMPALADTNAAEHTPASLKARQFAQEQPELTIPTDKVGPDGSPVHIRAADAIAQADAEVAHTQATAGNLFLTAAHCLLGAL